MKNLSILLLLSFSLTACQNFAASKKSDEKNPVVSTYNGGEVTMNDVDSQLARLAKKNDDLKGITFAQLKKEQKEALVKEFVLNQLIYKEAKKRKLDRDENYQEALRIFETELLKQKLFNSLIKEAAQDDNVKKSYDELVMKLKGKKEIRIRYIALKTQKEAQDVYKDLQKSPRSFAEIAKKKSIDKDSAAKGGDLGFIVEDSLPIEVVKEVRAVKKGEIIKPVFAAKKWIVAKLEGERKAEIIPFEKAKENLTRSLAKKAIEDFLKQNLEKAQVSLVQ